MPEISPTPPQSAGNSDDSQTPGQATERRFESSSEISGETEVATDRTGSRRRRGSRGGKNRKKSAASNPSGVSDDVSDDGGDNVSDDGGDNDGDDVARHVARDRDPNPDLPDLPWEGTVLPPEGSRRSRPKVGDSMPGQAPSPQTSQKPRSNRSKAQPTPQPNLQPNLDDDVQKQTRPQLPRSGRNRQAKPSVNESAVNEPAFTEPAIPVSGSTRSEQRAGTPAESRRRKKTRGAADDASQLADQAEARKGRERNGKPVGRYLMSVHVRPTATQIAVLEGRSLIEHYVSQSSDDSTQIHGNIYLGRVQNVLPGMEAAFVDISTPKNAVLYRSDVAFDAGDVETSNPKAKDARIEQLLKNGQLVVCQITKNPIGQKGARLTQEVSLPGRFVVLVPNSGTYGISKRLPDEERRRLRRILDEVRPEQHGIIVRTAAAGTSADELRRDVALLVATWEKIEAKARKARGPALLHREPDLAVRIIREEFNADYRGVVIDNREVFEEVRSYVESISPELADRVEFHDPDEQPLPIFERHHVHEQLHKAIDRKVWLPSGGSLIIERTEALTVIDVNTGKNVGSTSLEETVYRNNLEAAQEIARQLRLRDIGGIIVIDFIDMEIRANRTAVVSSFREALTRDKTRTQVFEISDLGLVEMTRKRISEGLVEALSDTCPTCNGRGFIFDPEILDE